ncbi:MAG TPA: SAM-dependent methyltransferase [Actinomycetota bacterium]|nr:SAM-dependent methyltransferase [Actinomycetota bacterium]
MSEEVTARIVDAAREHGPITFKEFMEHALYGPGGFYETPPVGREGHFVTSPHVHPVFADLMRFALLEAWDALGRPEPLRVVELGAGDGTLARALLVGFEAGRVPVEYAAVEVSPGARERLVGLELAVLERADEVEPLEPGVVLANELLDNLPFRRVRRREDGLVEVRIGVQDDRLVEVETPCDDDLAALAPPLEPDAEATVPVTAIELVDTLGKVLRRGYALFVDYGSTDGPAGEVHGYREHGVLADVLDDPGSADVTAGVDLGAIARRAEEVGLVSLGSVRQWRALRALGYERWAASERERQSSMLAEGRGLDAVRSWEGRSRASLLVDPGALGRLRWLLLATPELPRPRWLEIALQAEAADHANRAEANVPEAVEAVEAAEPVEAPDADDAYEAGETGEG